jgi:hypothetical protein
MARPSLPRIDTVGERGKDDNASTKGIVDCVRQEGRRMTMKKEDVVVDESCDVIT